MKKIVYPLIATALITIAPFLATFEKGQDIVHGLFSFSILALLLFFLSVRDSSIKMKMVVLVAIYGLLFVVSIVDLQNILFLQGKTVSWHFVIPLATCFFAVVLLKPIKALRLSEISFFLFAVLVSHLYLGHFFPEQPLLEFPVAKRLAQTAPNDWSRNHLTDDFRLKHNATDSVSVTRCHVDTTRSNVVVLVESWGIPLDTSKFNEEIALFNGILKEQGVHFRMYSRTRTAEREDLLDSAWKDSVGRRDSLFMPKRFAELGYKTFFLFGGDSTIQRRYKYIRNIGFQNVFWTDSTTADSIMVAKLDSLLNEGNDSLAVAPNRKFIAWTTRDTRFPIRDNPIEVEKLYYARLFGTLQMVADLAKRHPEVRFVVQGDHEPILSPIEFQKKFYKRWVPFVVLN